MKYEYSKPSLEIINWPVTKEDIGRIHDFFRNRFSIQNVEMSLTTTNGITRIYDNYDEFLKDLEKIIKDSEKIEKVNISHSYREDISSNKSKHVWIDINFRHNKATFYIICGDEDGSYKDWFLGTYDEMLRFADIFSIKDSIHSKIFLKNYPSVVFDYKGDIREKLEDTYQKYISLQRQQKKNRSPKVIFKKIFYNKWAVGIGTVVISGIILSLLGIRN